MQVAIIDNGLEAEWGHSYAINKALKESLAARGIGRRLFTYVGAEAKVRDALDGETHFTRPLYDSEPPARLERWLARLRGDPIDRPSERATGRALNAAFEADLRRLPRDIWRDGIVLFVGLTQHEILGLARFAAAHADSLQASIVCQLMFTPDWLPWGEPSRLGAATYGEAFRLLRPMIGRTFSFTTENDHVARHYKEHYGVETRLLPVPLAGAPRKVRSDGRIRLGFFGYSKCEKGFHLLPEALALSMAARPDLEASVQVQHYETEPTVVAAADALRRMQSVRILDGALDAARYADETAAIDIVLLPYHPELFGMRGSGIFVESVSAGRPIVAARDTAAGHAILKGKAVGEVFAPYTSQALSAAILRLCDDLPAHSQRAVAQATQHAAETGIERYVDTLLALAR